MFLSSLYAFKDTVSDVVSENLIMVDDAAVVSDNLDLVAAKIADGGGELFLNVYCTAKGSLTADRDIVILLEGSALGTTFQTFATKTVNTSVQAAEHDLLAIGEIMKVPLGPNLPRYLRLTATPGDSMAENVTLKAFISTT